MFRNYLTIAWRNLTRNKIYSFINISGLAVGLAACMLIVLYMGHEYSYDSFHKGADRIFTVGGKIMMGKDSIFIESLSPATAPMVKENNPSVLDFVRTKRQRDNTIVQRTGSADLRFSESKFVFADSNFFNFFSFNLLEGDRNTVLQKPFSVVITKSTAQKYFGKEDPIGKTVTYNGTYDFVITGVAEKIPSNSSIDFDFVASLSSMRLIPNEANAFKSQMVEPGNFKTYFLLKDASQTAQLEKHMRDLNKRTDPGGDAKTGFFATAITATHMKANFGDFSNIKYIKIFPLVAALVLLLALINYINLSTARATTRAKEIGVRKVIGAGRKSIAVQFFLESALYASIAFALGFVICVFFQKPFFDFLQIDLDKSFLTSPQMLASFTALFLLTIILSGTYPSILLSAYKPVLTLYGKITRHKSGISLRRFTTVFQFGISIVLIVCGLIMNKQLVFFRNTDTGVNKENIVMIPFDKSIGSHYSAFKKNIQELPAVSQTTTSQSPMYKGHDIIGTTPKDAKEMIFLPVLTVDENFINTLEIKWAIPPANATVLMQPNTMVLNEKAVENLNLEKNPTSEKVDNNYAVAGVVKDFNFFSLHSKIAALGLIINTDRDTASRFVKSGGCLFVKLKANTNAPTAIAQIKKIYGQYGSAKPFEYSFMDESFDALYKAEEKLVKILGVFTLLTVIISCLGLLGLSTFMALQRTKEIGIRKVLGASATQLAALLSKDFLRLVLISVVIASPVAWWAMNSWLKDFAYRVNIGWVVFIVAGVAALGIALLTVGFQAIKTALANPVKSLRSE